jgi:hypothetical protein
MKHRKTITLAVLVLLFANTTTVAGDKQPPEVSLDGLTLVEKDRRGEIYADKDADWSVYSQVHLEPATVSFRKNWKRDQNRYDSFKVRDRDIEKIKTALSELFHDVFARELSGNGGYQMTEETGENVMTIKPSIVDLDVAAPDTNQVGRTTSYTQQAGRMTLILEIYDSTTGDLIARGSDRQESPRRGYMQWTNSITNTADARRMLEKWATALRVRLDEASGSTP